MSSKTILSKYKNVALLLMLGTAILIMPTSVFLWVFQDRIYPNVYVNDIPLGGKNIDEAQGLLLANLSAPQITLILESQVIATIASEQIDLVYDIEKTATHAINSQRSIGSLLSRKNIAPVLTYNDEKLANLISDIAGSLAVEPVYPSARLKDGVVLVEAGKKGQNIQIDKLKTEIISRLTNLSTSPIEIEISEVDPTLSEEQVITLKENAEKLKTKSVKLVYENEELILADRDLVPILLSGPSEKLNDVKKIFEREPQNSVFVYEDSKVKEFKPSKPGIAINSPELEQAIEEKLQELINSSEKMLTINLPVAITNPEITNSEVNNLGIKELIGRGTSKFRGSIPARVHNVALATSRVNGALIKPGETFSFNLTLGDISKLTGYKEAYVIKEGKTVLGDGGGVCQVSTTLFRAVLDSGLPIRERRAHAYRVYYYEQDTSAGMDATVYSPTTDFKFVNDTPGHILIQAVADTKNMTMTIELYGTSDGREATTTKPTIRDVVAPPEDLYLDDPTLPAGQVKQTEHKASGAKVVFDYSVKRNGEVIYQKQFVSNYRPWGAVYQRGTGPTQ